MVDAKLSYSRMKSGARGVPLLGVAGECTILSLDWALGFNRALTLLRAVLSFAWQLIPDDRCASVLVYSTADSALPRASQDRRAATDFQAPAAGS